MSQHSVIDLPEAPFRREHVLAQGVTRNDFYALVREGVIRPVVREAFVRGDADDSVALRAAAVALVVADGHVVVDRTAAAIHGRTFRPSRRAPRAGGVRLSAAMSAAGPATLAPRT